MSDDLFTNDVPDWDKIASAVGKASAGDKAALDLLYANAHHIGHRWNCSQRAHPASECDCPKSEVVDALEWHGYEL